MSTVNEMYEQLKQAIEDGHGELKCFGTDGQGMSYEVETYGNVKTARYVEGGPLLEADPDMEYLSFSLDY